MDKDTQKYVGVGIGLALAGFLWNKFKGQDISASYTSQNLSKPTISNTGIAGGIIDVASQIVKSLPAKTNTTTTTTTTQAQQQSEELARPATQGQLVDVVGQFNNIVSNIINGQVKEVQEASNLTPTPATTTVNQTKFNDAVAWAKNTNTQISQGVSGWPFQKPTSVWIATGTTLYQYDLTGKFITSQSDNVSTRSKLVNKGYKIF